MNRRIKVVYSGNLDEELDQKIRAVMESLGARWSSQSYSYGRGDILIGRERSICFDLEENKL